MSEIARWDLWDGQMSHSVSGLWVRYAAHQFEVERLATELAEAHERCRALELSIEQADELKAHAEASAAAEEAETDRVTVERDAAQAEIERLRAEVERLRTTLAWADATIYRLQAERDQTETRPKGREVGRFGLDGHYLDAMEPERPTDEDIWREGFMRCLNDVAAEDWHAQADLVLKRYRERWPR